MLTVKSITILTLNTEFKIQYFHVLPHLPTLLRSLFILNINSTLRQLPP